MLQLLKITTNKNFNSTLFDLLINSNKLRKSPVKLANNILILPADFKIASDIAKRNELKILDAVIV